MTVVEGFARRTGQNSGMALALITATVAQMLDLGTFVRMIAIHGPIAEGNPLVAGMLDQMGLPFVAVTKLVALSLVVAIVAVLWGRDDHRRYPRLAAAILGCAIAAGVFGAWTNATVIL
jgi:uncharacterized protein (DUF697 family)